MSNSPNAKTRHGVQRSKLARVANLEPHPVGNSVVDVLAMWLADVSAESLAAATTSAAGMAPATLRRAKREESPASERAK